TQRVHRNLEAVAVAQKLADQRDGLQIGAVDALGLVVGVADIVANQGAFTGQFAAAGHDIPQETRLERFPGPARKAGFIREGPLWVKAWSRHNGAKMAAILPLVGSGARQ